MSFVDGNGMWAWVINGHEFAIKAFNSFYEPIPFINSKMLTDKLNSYYYKWLNKAPKISEYLKKSDIRVGIVNMIHAGGNIEGTKDISLNIQTINEEFENQGSSQESTFFHELIHTMGAEYDEVEAYAAQAAMGFRNLEKILNKMGELLDDNIHKMIELTRFFKDNKLIKGKENVFYNALVQYGQSIIK